MKDIRLNFTKSNKFIVQSHKPIIPTIVYFHASTKCYVINTFKFVFWKWWFMISLTYQKQSSWWKRLDIKKSFILSKTFKGVGLYVEINENPYKRLVFRVMIIWFEFWISIRIENGSQNT